jgi:hypothetical protein
VERVGRFPDSTFLGNGPEVAQMMKIQVFHPGTIDSPNLSV